MTDSNQYQKRYWKELFELRVHVNYLKLYMEKSECLDKFINISLAITSSSSIGLWAIWKKYSFLWAIIIAASQVLNVVNQFLPYKTRIKITCGILKELEELLNSYETKWFDIAEGKLKNDEINKLQFEIRTEKTKIIQKHIGKNTLPEKGRMFKKAKQLAEIYINNYYGENK